MCSPWPMPPCAPRTRATVGFGTFDHKYTTAGQFFLKFALMFSSIRPWSGASTEWQVVVP